MAGFLLYRKDQQLNMNVVSNLFQENGYNEGYYIDLGDWQIYLLPKKLYKIKNWFMSGNDIITCCGTFCYKGLFYEKALERIIDDMEKNIINNSDFYGTFTLIIKVKNKLRLVRDGSEIYKIYKISNCEIYSSSFYVLNRLMEEQQELNIMPTLELLNTGCIMGEDTILKKIKLHRLSDNIPGFETILGVAKQYRNPQSYKEAVLQQIDITKNYIKTIGDAWNYYIKGAPIDIGLTGGLDSRYIAGLVLKENYNLVFHTHWRKKQNKNLDFRFAKGLAHHLSIPISSKDVMDPLDLSNEQLADNFNEAYKFCDAIIRPGCYWDEPYSTFQYRENIRPTPYLRLLGFGGEQYRNMERLPIKANMSLESWIKWEMIYKFAGGYLDKKKYNELISYLSEKLKKQISYHYLNLITFKEYNRNVVSVSYRSIQTNLENKIGFCLSPYLDIQLSDPSFLAIPYLGNSFRFHLDMLKIVSPELAKYPNSYGFDFFRGEPLSSRMAATIWQLLPVNIKYPLHSVLYPHKSNYIEQLSKNHQIIREFESIIKNVLFELKYNNYRKVVSRSKMALNLAFFLKQNRMVQ